jgi:hypothetical protein
MKDIKFLGTDGDFLLLEDATGQKFRLLLDDSIRRAFRNEPTRQLDSFAITPREIQEEVRAGRSIEEVVQASGAPDEYVRKFAQPVLDELNHAVLNALTVRLEVAGDRFREPTAWEFGEIIKSRLAASGAGIERWYAKKAPDHGYFIYCEFELGDETKRASWSYDPRRLALTPENEVAISLSSQERIGNAPRLRPVQDEPQGLTANLAETVDLAADLISRPLAPSVVQEDSNDEPPLSETADLLDALRRKRAERESVEQLEPHPETEGLRVVEVPPEVYSEDAVTEEDKPETQAPKKGRASIPSWDEIVFGTKPEDQ